jgi:hypothetical protein
MKMDAFIKCNILKIKYPINVIEIHKILKNIPHFISLDFFINLKNSIISLENVISSTFFIIQPPIQFFKKIEKLSK